MQVRAIDFVVINVSDVERARAFYQDTLGMSFPLIEFGDNWKEIDAPPVALALRQDKTDPGVNAAIALAVDDVYAAVEELRAKGIEMLFGPSESESCYSALFRDPDGNLLLLHQRKDGTAG